MSDTLPKGLAAPIIEAVLDIECDMPPAFDLGALEEGAGAAFRDRYPKLRIARIQEAKIEALSDATPKLSLRHGIQGFQLFQQDEKQLVQVRAPGFSFNRLAPYSSLDDYLPEIERSWRLYVELASPLQVRLVRLRYINRILLPVAEGQVELMDYLAMAPRLPKEDRLNFVAFLQQHAAVETETGHRANVTLTNQPAEPDRLPIILDIEVLASGALDPGDWPLILARIKSLRSLKNMVFRSTLTDQCLKLFQA